MALASIGKSPRTADSTSVDSTIDVEGISARTDLVLAMQMGTTTREDMDASLPLLVRHLSSLLNLDLGQAEDQDVQRLCRKGRTLIEHGTRPTNETPAFGVFIYLRDTALVARHLLWIYAEQEGVSAP
ncbi:hypothetical protein [Streptomyces sp. NPDC058603]|uniref:hypothetical protein n=1 Tax=unclassified Streptomyces TaxID=2593676 RepID=UPI003659A619